MYLSKSLLKMLLLNTPTKNSPVYTPTQQKTEIIKIVNIINRYFTKKEIQKQPTKHENVFNIIIHEENAN